MPQSVVLVSGGLASAVVAALAADEGETVWLHVNYGQPNGEREAAAVEGLAAEIKPVSTLTLRMHFWDDMGDFPLLSARDQIPDGRALDRGPDPTYIPGLLPAMLSAALDIPLPQDVVTTGHVANGTAVDFEPRRRENSAGARGDS